MTRTCQYVTEAGITRHCVYVYPDGHTCGAEFTVATTSNNRKYCKECSQRANRESRAESERLRCARLRKMPAKSNDTRTWPERREAIRNSAYAVKRDAATFSDLEPERSGVTRGHRF